MRVIPDGPLGKLTLSRSDLDRSAEQRSDPALIQTLLGQADTRIVDVIGGLAPIAADGSLVLRPAGPANATLNPPEPGEAEVIWVFLGRDEHGTGYLSRLQPGAEPPTRDGVRWQGLRDAAAQLDDRQAGLFTTSLALSNWHHTHRFCPRCGQPTAPGTAGWVRVCQADGSEHYPRTDPAIIVAVVDGEDRLLLGHNAIWPEGRFSTLAGFVEPGEPLEEAVRREVFEEAGVRVGEVTFLASQPWPFPASLMLGCAARALSSQIQVDGAEVSQACWFSRDELRDGILAGTVIPPGGVSIARRLVERWFGGPIPDGPVPW